MPKLLCFTLLFLASVRAEETKNKAVPLHNAPGRTRDIPRTDIFQPNFNQMHRYRDTRSAGVELLMHLPPQFKDVESFRSFLGIRPERFKRYSSKDKSKGLIDVRSYEFSQSTPSERRRRFNRRVKRQAVPDSETVESRPLKIENDPGLEPGKFIPTSAMEGSYSDQYPETIIELPAPVRGPIYTSYPAAESELDVMDPDDPRKRRNTSANDHDDGNQREKRTFMEAAGENRESTTTPPFWKRKKESPPFITGREGRVQKGSNYTPAQHRSGDTPRESHSMKDLDKSVQSNEIPRPNQDSYYASSNRRAYNSRQAENFTPPPPKSVYDTIDYSNSRRNQDGRSGFGRNFDGNKENMERNRQTYDSGTFARQYAYPRVYDRYYYPFPYPGEVLGRGVEYYHRTYDPASGRIVYYANMPDHGAHYDPNVRRTDPTGRSFYVNGRTYVYDPYGRSYILPYDYRFVDAYGRPLDYMRNGRNGAETYSTYQGGEKIPRDARYDTRYEKVDRYKDDFRNKTYVIYDAEENRPQYPRLPYPSADIPRYGYPAPPVIPPSQAPYRPVPGTVPPAYPSYRNQYYPPAPPSPWATSSRPLVSGPDMGYTTRPYNSPEVQLPLATSNRNLPPPGSYDKLKKT